jgi:hypothetical protein
MQVKKYLRTALLLLAAGLLIAGIAKHKPAYRPQPLKPITMQQRAEHRIKINNSECTATAVGPHALLTAVHCNEDSKVDLIIDMSMTKFHILAKTLDGRDHVIYIIDGPELHNIIKLAPGTHPARPFEHVYIYGCGDGIFPPIRKEGVKTYVVQDLSEIDQSEGVNFYTIPVIPGDSGSAIYGEDGRVVSVMTYKMAIPKDGNWDTEDEADIIHLGVGFDLNFTATQLANIAAGHGDTSLGKKAPAMLAPTPVK